MRAAAPNVGHSVPLAAPCSNRHTLQAQRTTRPRGRPSSGDSSPHVAARPPVRTHALIHESLGASLAGVRSSQHQPGRWCRAERTLTRASRPSFGAGGGYDPGTFTTGGSAPQFGASGARGLGGAGTALAPSDGGGALKAKEATKTVQARFWLKFHVDYGQTVRIIGGHEQMGAWNLGKAPFLRWSEGDLWNVTLELAAGGVYEYKYVVVEGDGVTAASWQRGANNVLALQMGDGEVEVYDNWKNAPGSLVLSNGEEMTRERKLLAWASDMTLQRGELRKTRLELAQAREEIRVLRAELSVLRMEVSEANVARSTAESRQLELERSNSALRMEVASTNATARSTMEEAARLLNDMADDSPMSEASMRRDVSASAGQQAGGEYYAQAGVGIGGSGGGAGAGSDSVSGMFGGLFGIGMSPADGSSAGSRVQSKVVSPTELRSGVGSGAGSSASAVAAAAAAAAATNPLLRRRSAAAEGGVVGGIPRSVRSSWGSGGSVASSGRHAATGIVGSAARAAAAQGSVAPAGPGWLSSGAERSSSSSNNSNSSSAGMWQQP